MGEYFLTKLETLLSHPIIGDVRGKGMMLGFEIVKDKATKEPFPPAMRMSVRLETEALRRGLVTFSCTGSVDGVAGDMMLIATPFIITEAEIDACVQILHDSVSAIERNIA
jgi:adenosylmethionine-8-amino-7-oxononanoate aminotransferase